MFFPKIFFIIVEAQGKSSPFQFVINNFMYLEAFFFWNNDPHENVRFGRPKTNIMNYMIVELHTPKSYSKKDL